jgi:hypothetical protein
MKSHYLLCLLFLAVLPGCAGKKTSTADLYNQSASLPDTVSFNPLEWKVITSSLNKKEETLATLYGNDLAVKSARKGTAYPAGSVIALVNWKQKEDERWFGARIPGTVLSVERVSFNDQISYEKYEGTPLRKSVTDSPSTVKSRIAYLAGQRASVMP